MFPRRFPTGGPVRRASTLVAVALLAVAASGCAFTPDQMNAKQKEAAEVRAYCLKNPDDVVTCLGFLGDH